MQTDSTTTAKLVEPSTNVPVLTQQHPLPVFLSDVHNIGLAVNASRCSQSTSRSPIFGVHAQPLTCPKTRSACFRGLYSRCVRLGRLTLRHTRSGTRSVNQDVANIYCLCPRSLLACYLLRDEAACMSCTHKFINVKFGCSRGRSEQGATTQPSSRCFLVLVRQTQVGSTFWIK